MYNSSLYFSQSRPSRPTLSLRSVSELPPSPSHARGKMSRFSDNNISSSNNMISAFRSLFLSAGGSDDEGQWVPPPITALSPPQATASSLLLHSGKTLTSPTYSSSSSSLSSLQYDGKQFTPYSQRYHQTKRDSNSPQWLMGYGALGVWQRGKGGGGGGEKTAHSFTPNLLSPINESKSSQSISASTSSFLSPSSSVYSTRSSPSPMRTQKTTFFLSPSAVFTKTPDLNVMMLQSSSQMIGSFIMASIFVWHATLILAFLTLMHYATIQKTTTKW